MFTVLLPVLVVQQLQPLLVLNRHQRRRSHARLYGAYHVVVPALVERARAARDARGFVGLREGM
jgi:hypothetical protein